MIDLYYWPTPNGQKPAIFLREAQLPHKIVPVNIGEGAQFAPSFLKIAPNNRIPAIVDFDVEGEPVALFVVSCRKNRQVYTIARAMATIGWPGARKWQNHTGSGIGLSRRGVECYAQSSVGVILGCPALSRQKRRIAKTHASQVLDGDYQTYRANSGAYIREHFFGVDPQLRAMVADMTDDDIWRLNRGGHDPHKVYAAYHQASEHKGQPTVVLAKTIKGYGTGQCRRGAKYRPPKEKD